MKKKSMIIAAAMLLGAAFTANAQVTIGSDTYPQTTLDVVASKTDGSTAEGIMAPRLTLVQLKAADAKYTTDQTGAFVYVTNATGGTTPKTANVTAAGYYYFDGTLWHAVGGGDSNTLYTFSFNPDTRYLTITPSGGGTATDLFIPMPWFYMPTAVLPTTTASPEWNGTEFVYDMYQTYIRQFSMTDATSSASSEAATIPVYAANRLIYMVVYYDKTVFTDVSVAADGKLHYKVIAGATPTPATFMNVIFKLKH